MDQCDECGFVYEDVARFEIAPTIRSLAGEYRSRLVPADDPTGAAALVRRRPEPEVWSPLEYACHVRDVLVVQRDRLRLALVEDLPSFEPMYREQRVLDDRYNEQEPAVVAHQLEVAGGALADDFATLRGDDWLREGMYNWPEPTARTLEWIGRHTIHELRHHLGDVDRGLAAAGSL